MIKENVLKIEYQPVFDKYAVKIVYQNEKILERNKFNDCGVKSVTRIEYRDCTFYIRGDNIEKDNDVIVVNWNELQDIIEKVNKVNEKYGTTKRWRTHKGGKYHYIDTIGCVNNTTENYDWTSDRRYELGNYFETGDQARRVLKSIQWKNLWEDVRRDKLKFGV